MVENGTKSDHLDRLGSPGVEMVQNGTKTNHLDRLGLGGGWLKAKAERLTRPRRGVFDFRGGWLKAKAERSTRPHGGVFDFSV